MITSRRIRNALTGAITVLALGLFASCVENPTAPSGVEPSLALASSTTQTCTFQGGQWVCTTSPQFNTTNDGGDDEGDGGGHRNCILIGGVLYCEPGGGE